MSSGNFQGADAKSMAHGCLARGLMLLTCGPWDNTIRWIPLLVMKEEQIQRAGYFCGQLAGGVNAIMIG